MEKKIKHILVGTGVVPLLILILFCSIVLYLKTDHALRTVEARINQALPGSVAIGAFDFSILKGTVQLKKLTLRDPNGKELAGMDEIFVQISLPALLKREILIETASLSGPWADIMVDKDGRINLETAFPSPTADSPASETDPETKGLPFNIIIKTFSMNGGSITCKIPHENFDCSLPNLALNIFELNLKALSGKLSLETEKGVLAADDLKTDIERIELNVTSVRGSLTQLLFNATSPVLKAAIKGSITDLVNVQNLTLQPHPQLNLQVNLDLFLSKFEKLTGLKNNDNQKNNIAGQIKLRSHISGPADQPTAEVDINGKELRLNGLTFEKTEIKGNLTPSGKLNFSEILVQNGPSSISGNGELDLFKGSLERVNYALPFNFAFSFSDLKPGDLLGDESISGVLNGRLNMSGDMTRPTATLEVQGKDLGAKDFTAGQLDLLVKFADGSLLIERAELKRENSYIKAGGGISVLNKETGKPLTSPVLGITLQGELLLDDYINTVSGSISIDGNLNGTIINPVGDFKVNGKTIGFEGQVIKELNLSARVAEETVFLDDFTALITEKEQITAKGSLCFGNSTYDMELESTPISLAHADKYFGEDPIQGNLSLQLHGKGSLSSPLVEGKVELTDLIVNHQTVDNFKIDIKLENQLVSLWGTPGFKIDGSYRIDTRSFKGAVKFDDTDLTPYFKLAGLPKFSGNISCDIEASGNANTPEMTDAHISLSNIRILSDQREILHSKGLSLNLKNGNFEIPKSQLTLIEKSTVSIVGSGNIKGDVKLTAQGGLPLKALAIVSGQVENPVGDIKFSANLEGPFSSPELTASVALQKIGLTTPMLEGRIHNLSGKITLTKDKATIHQLGGKLDDGTFSAGGECSLDKFKPVELRLNLETHQLPVKIPESLDLVLNSNLTISGTGEKAMISGEINILEGLYYKDLDVSLADLAQKNRKFAPMPQPGTTHPLVKNTKLNIRIKTRDPFVVDNNIAQITLVSNIQLYGTAENPHVQGQAKTEQGVITFRGKEFEVKKGIIDFVNPYKIDPELDFESQVEIGEWAITLSVAGTADNIEFELSSSPSEDNADILSIIAFGKKLDQQSGYTSSATRQIAAEVVGDKLSRGLKDATGLDTVELKMEDGENDDSEQVSITIGKELSRRISVSYGMDIKSGKTVQRVTTGYKLLEPLRINAYQDTEGDFGAEVQYKHEFR